jgi:peptidoglycan/LPS O-acetylase OafA/YrhL
MGVFYLLVPFAIVGGVALRRRGVPIFPLVGLVVVATVAAALFFANGRYRSEGDLAVAILAGIGIDALLAHFLKKRRREGVNV